MAISILEKKLRDLDIPIMIFMHLQLEKYLEAIKKHEDKVNFCDRRTGSSYTSPDAEGVYSTSVEEIRR